MSGKILIDAVHEEETRVVVVHDDRVEEFDFESASRRQVRGNIYLAKVTRVEPSLQVAFVDYGGNKHGFLAFGEIHPDYYQIPLADREAILREVREEREDCADGLALSDASGESDVGTTQVLNASAEFHRDGNEDEVLSGQPDAVMGDAVPEFAGTGETPADDVSLDSSGNPKNAEDESVEESLEAVDPLDEIPSQRFLHRRNKYKIQEVIKKRQILLVQVVKEERGSKGAAVTTYLSMAGRYCVLMPNTIRGGGISRKITNASDRRKLKSVIGELQTQLPEGMSVILRTAGINRTKTEIKRDFDYLVRLWEEVRDLTLQSTAPALVYREGSVITRSIRDLYSRDVDEVLVSGADAYREAKGFMRTLMPSHARFVRAYEEKIPIFSRYNVESQLDAMFAPEIILKSGGRLVIDQTEALVAIDVNSGRATREHDIEATALATNLEAAIEIAYQLRLRDLAGLIVIDFIDMEEKRHQRAVENKFKECLRRDRARLQIGRISDFGLLEMSRQRMRVSLTEGSRMPCTHCCGTGTIRSIESLALHLLRSVEEWMLGRTDDSSQIVVGTDPEVALYVLNKKRHYLRELEEHFAVSIIITGDERSVGGIPVISGANDADQSLAVAETATLLGTASVVTEESAHTAQEKQRSGKQRRTQRGPIDSSSSSEKRVLPSDDAAPGASSHQVSSRGSNHDASGNNRERVSSTRRRRRNRNQRTTGSADSATSEILVEKSDNIPRSDENQVRGRRLANRNDNLDETTAQGPPSMGEEASSSHPENSPSRNSSGRFDENRSSVVPETMVGGNSHGLGADGTLSSQTAGGREQPLLSADVHLAKQMESAGSSPPRRGWWSRRLGRG